MNRSAWSAVAVTATLVAAATVFALRKTSPGDEPQSPKPEPARIEATAAGDVDSVPELDRTALAALGRMGAYLRTLQAFQLNADVVTEDVRTDGQKVRILRAVDLVAQRPNRLYAEVTNDRQRRLFFYDGKTFTLFAPRPNFYATVAAPATIAQLADELEAKYDVQLPLVDLFRWGTPEAEATAFTAAVDLGPSAVNGITCEQYAFRQAGLDWQLWIQRGANPLPCRLVITTTSDEARPQHMATYTWNLAPSYDDDTFAFHRPLGAKRIPFAEARGVASSSSTGRQ